LIEKIFFDVDKYKVEIEVRKTPEGYQHKVKYGRPSFPFPLIAEYQEIAERNLDELLKVDSSTQGVILETTYKKLHLDPFGIYRLNKYLSNK